MRDTGRVLRSDLSPGCIAFGAGLTTEDEEHAGEDDAASGDNMDWRTSSQRCIQRVKTGSRPLTLPQLLGDAHRSVPDKILDLLASAASNRPCLLRSKPCSHRDGLPFAPGVGAAWGGGDCGRSPVSRFASPLCPLVLVSFVCVSGDFACPRWEPGLRTFLQLCSRCRGGIRCDAPTGCTVVTLPSARLCVRRVRPSPFVYLPCLPLPGDAGGGGGGKTRGP